jgi:microcystin degradation protein MlrC
LIPGEKGITSVEPVRSFYDRLPEIGRMEGLMDASIYVGMPWTDVKRAGMSVQVVAEDDQYLKESYKQVEELANAIWDQRHHLQFDVETAEIDDAIRTAQISTDSSVFITDSGGNVTAGATGDGTLVLERMLANRISRLL